MQIHLQPNYIFLPSDHPVSSEEKFERLYVALRKKENRLYTDEQVNRLPHIDPSHPHFTEWKIRKRSADRLVRYLEKKKRPLSILEVGCGNGWLSAKLSGIPNSTVTGMDINVTELSQATRVFGIIPNLQFINAQILNFSSAKKFDIIVFAASIQYFSSLYQVVMKAMSLLRDNGEVNILDSYLYQSAAVVPAKQRSVSYYRSLGFEGLAEFYFHHSAESLQSFTWSFLFNPSSLINRAFKKHDPFPWIRITRR